MTDATPSERGEGATVDQREPMGCGVRVATTSSGSEFGVTPGGCDTGIRTQNWAILCLSIIVILAIGGNVLVCLAVCYQRKLQNMFNYFLVSLALSDMLSAILVMPLSIVKETAGK